MINAILKGIFSIMNKLIGVLLTPINALLFTLLPDFADLLDYFYDMAGIVGQYFGWIMDMLCLNADVIDFMILYYTFKLTFPLMISGIKLIIKWYNALKV